MQSLVAGLDRRGGSASAAAVILGVVLGIAGLRLRWAWRRPRRCSGRAIG